MTLAQPLQCGSYVPDWLPEALSHLGKQGRPSALDHVAVDEQAEPAIEVARGSGRLQAGRHARLIVVRETCRSLLSLGMILGTARETASGIQSHFRA